MLDAVEVTTGDAPRFAVVWLHGLGADGHDFEPIVPELRVSVPVRFVFPHAPVRPVTINGGMQMRAWYDILGFDRRAKEDAPGIHASAAAVTELVDREIERGLSSDRIVLAGFSQGGAIALHTALRSPKPLGGVLALSTYLPLAPTLASERTEANAAIPLFMAHGTDDPVLPFGLAETSRRALEGLGYVVDWHAYRMAHSVCMEEVRAVGAWLSALPAARG